MTYYIVDTHFGDMRIAVTRSFSEAVEAVAKHNKGQEGRFAIRIG